MFQLADECQNSHPRVANIIRSDFYVDDLLTGSDSIEELKDIIKGIKHILEKGCFPLRKRISNGQTVFDSFTKEHPAILYRKHPLTPLILENEHHRLLHGGAQLILASVRERFWPTSGRNLAKHVVRTCTRCKPTYNG